MTNDFGQFEGEETNFADERKILCQMKMSNGIIRIQFDASKE